ncbi:MAG: hypothetical protein ACRCXT_07360, partial [Paraclostridium sp.]
MGLLFIYIIICILGLGFIITRFIKGTYNYFIKGTYNYFKKHKLVCASVIIILMGTIMINTRNNI